MTERPPSYVATLTHDLRTQRPDLLRAAEDELQHLRHALRTVTRFINNPHIALDIRQGLARDLHLPEPTQ